MNIPKGPSIFTTGRAAIGEARPFFFAEGARIVKLTSGGIDNGALPICDGRFGVEENDREPTAGNAGRRNAGIETDGAEANARSRPFDRAVESIVMMPRT